MSEEKRNNPPAKMGPPGRGVQMPMCKAKNFKKSIKSLILSLRSYRFIVILALTFAIASTTFNIAAPEIIKKIGNHIVVANSMNIPIDMSKIAYFGIILISMYVLSALLNLIQGVIMARVTSRVTKKYRTDLAIKINKLPLKYFDRKSFGDTLSRITNDVDTLGHSLSNSLSSIISSATMLLGSVIMMLVNSPLLTLVMFCMLPISGGLILLVVKFSQKYFVRQQKELGDIIWYIANMAEDLGISLYDVINTNVYKILSECMENKKI